MSDTYPPSFAPLLNLDGVGPRMAERYRERAERARELLHEYGPVKALEHICMYIVVLDPSAETWTDDSDAERVFAPLARWLAGEWGT